MTRRVFRLSNHFDHPGIQLRKRWLPMIGIEDKHATRLAPLVQMDRGHITKILSGRADIDDQFAIELARVFNTVPEFWLALQSAYEHAQQEWSK
jgi:addiction module HigA family antidote